MMEIKRACPFCASTNTEYKTEYLHKTSELIINRGFIECFSCGARSPFQLLTEDRESHEVNINDRDAENLVTIMWNKAKR